MIPNIVVFVTATKNPMISNRKKSEPMEEIHIRSDQ